MLKRLQWTLFFGRAHFFCVAQRVCLLFACVFSSHSLFSRLFCFSLLLVVETQIRGHIHSRKALLPPPCPRRLAPSVFIARKVQPSSTRVSDTQFGIPTTEVGFYFLFLRFVQTCRLHLLRMFFFFPTFFKMEAKALESHFLECCRVSCRCST